MNKSINNKWYNNNSLVIILLLIFFPVGLYALWKNTSFTTKTKSILTAVVIVLFFIFAYQDNAQNTQSDVSKKNENKQSELLTTELRNKSIEQEIAEFKKDYNTIVTKVNQLITETPPFAIQGEIIDREKDSLAIYGTAYAVGGGNPFGNVPQKASIVLLNPNQKDIMGKFYRNFNGIHYFIKKSQGQNAFGATVPVWVYGEEPEEIKSGREKAKKIMENGNALRKKYITRILAKKRKIPEGENEAIAKLKDLNASLTGINSFKNITIGTPKKSVIQLTEKKGSIDEIELFMFPEDGVIVMADDESVVSLIYLLQAETLKTYYSLVDQLNMPSSYKSDMPLDAPLISNKDYIRKLSWGDGQMCDSYLPEICATSIKPIENNPEGNEYIFTCRTDGLSTDILAVAVCNLDKKRFATKYLPFEFSYIDSDPILGLKVGN